MKHVSRVVHISYMRETGEHLGTFEAKENAKPSSSPSAKNCQGLPRLHQQLLESILFTSIILSSTIPSTVYQGYYLIDIPQLILPCHTSNINPSLVAAVALSRS